MYPHFASFLNLDSDVKPANQPIDRSPKLFNQVKIIIFPVKNSIILPSVVAAIIHYYKSNELSPLGDAYITD